MANILEMNCVKLSIIGPKGMKLEIRLVIWYVLSNLKVFCFSQLTWGRGDNMTTNSFYGISGLGGIDK